MSNECGMIGLEESQSGIYFVSMVFDSAGQGVMNAKRIPDTAVDLSEDEFLDFICDTLNSGDRNL